MFELNFMSRRLGFPPHIRMSHNNSKKKKKFFWTSFKEYKFVYTSSISIFFLFCSVCGRYYNINCILAQAKFKSLFSIGSIFLFCFVSIVFFLSFPKEKNYSTLSIVTECITKKNELCIMHWHGQQFKINQHCNFFFFCEAKRNEILLFLNEQKQQHFLLGVERFR